MPEYKGIEFLRGKLAQKTDNPLIVRVNNMNHLAGLVMRTVFSKKSIAEAPYRRRVPHVLTQGNCVPLKPVVELFPREVTLIYLLVLITR